MQTLALYDNYIKLNLAPVRKALEKRMTNSNGMSSEGNERFSYEFLLDGNGGF